MKTLSSIENKILSKFELDQIDKKKALGNTRVLDLVREACLIESYFTEYTAKMIELFRYDVNATSIFTIEASEAFRHYLICRRYLDHVGYKPVSDEEVIALRDKDRGKVYSDEIRELVNFMMTEHFAAHFFNDLSKLTDEPVLKALLPTLAQEEVIHSQFAYDLLEARLRANPDLKQRVLENAKNFAHIGSYVLPQVSAVKEDNLKIIQSFNERIEELVGSRLSDYLINKQ
jgi:rubrerythrin